MKPFGLLINNLRGIFKHADRMELDELSGLKSLLVFACHTVIGTNARSLMWVITKRGRNIRDIACHLNVCEKSYVIVQR